MTQREKLIQRILKGDCITYQEAEKLLLLIGYTKGMPRGGSSHITYTKSPNKAITLVMTQKPLKKYLMKEIIEALKLENIQ